MCGAVKPAFIFCFKASSQACRHTEVERKAAESGIMEASLLIALLLFLCSEAGRGAFVTFSKLLMAWE